MSRVVHVTYMLANISIYFRPNDPLASVKIDMERQELLGDVLSTQHQYMYHIHVSEQCFFLTACFDTVVVIHLGPNDIAEPVLVPQLAVPSSRGHKDDRLALRRDIALDGQHQLVQLASQHEKLSFRHDCSLGLGIEYPKIITFLAIGVSE